MMYEVNTSEMSVSFFQIMLHNIPVHSHVHTCHCENLQSHIIVQYFMSETYKSWTKMSGTEFIVGKQKHLQVTQSYLLQSMSLQIVCSDSSDPSTFQCMSGKLVWEWPATTVSYLVVSPRRLEIVSPSGCSSAWGRGRSSRGPNLVRRVGNRRDAVLGQEFSVTEGRVAWRIVVVQKPGTRRPFVRPFPMICISKALQNSYVDSLIHGLALGKKLVMHQTLHVEESDQHCLDIWLNLPRVLRPRWRQRLPLWRHLFCLRFIAINPWFIPCDNAKFLAELDANMLHLQHIHFTIRWRDKHDRIVDQLTHDWVKLPPAPLVCGVRCCQVSYMVVTLILLVVSL
jgi:hypothetical protein